MPYGFAMVSERRTRSGFTIVELLIVIVVIGILAAITITAYNGVQSKARNAQIASAVIAYRKALTTYAIDKGTYPSPADICLGDGYPDLDNDGTAGDCTSDSGVVGYKVNAAFDAALKPYMKQKPNIGSILSFPSATRTQMGLQLRGIPSYTLDGVTHVWWLVYKTEGIIPCPVGPIPTKTGSAFVSTPPATGYTELWSSSSVQCIVPLPDPDSY